MESRDSSSRSASADGQLTSTQAELLVLLQKLVHLIVSDAMTNMQNLPEFRTMIRQLCEKAPEAAQTFIVTIQEFNNSNVPQQEPASLDDSTGQSVKRKSESRKDLSYRPSKSAKVKAAKTNSLDDSGQREDGHKMHIDSPAQDPALDGVQSPALNSVDTAQDVELNADVSSDVIDASQNKASLGLDQQQDVTQDECALKRDKTADDGDASSAAMDKEIGERIEETGATSASNQAENRQSKVSPESMPPPTSSPPAPVNMPPVTPLTQIEGALPSSQTEEVHREKTLTSVERISSSPKPRTCSSSDTASLMDMILEAVRVIHQFNKYPHGVPRKVHSRILQTLGKDHQGIIDTSSLNQWSDGSMWMRVLEMGSSENQKVTILNMLEYMGAWEWYEGQIEQSLATIRTKKNTPVNRRGAAMHVLNRMQGIHTDPEPPGKWISGVGRVALAQEEVESDLSPGSCNVGITERDRQLRRKRISMQLSRGQKLSTKLVKELGLGILFSSKIWEYTKKSVEQLSVMIKEVQADSKRMRLLQILGRQLERLINEGPPELHFFYDSLKEEKLVSEEEVQELYARFSLDADAMPQGTLDAAVDGLVKEVSSRVLGKRKLEDDDSVAVNNGVELSCNIFRRLRQGEWFDAWTIMAAMQISDKPLFVRHGYSVPLDEVGRNGRMKPVKRPLAGWARTMIKLHNEARKMFEDASRLVYFCPLNHKNMHFTLLEINEQEEVIRHYDPMADQGVIDGTTKLTRVGRLVKEEFGHLKYAYIEAPTPQQDDSWSCGVRAVWNFRHVSNNLPIGDWHAVQSPERMKMEIVEGLLACVEGNAMKKVCRTHLRES